MDKFQQFGRIQRQVRPFIIDNIFETGANQSFVLFLILAAGNCPANYHLSMQTLVGLFSLESCDDDRFGPQYSFNNKSSCSRISVMNRIPERA